MLGACATPALLPSPSPTSPRSVAPTATRSPSPSPSPAGPPDWSALAQQLRGTLVRPGDAAYDGARVLYNTRFDGSRPQAIARCVTPSDVQACVLFARRSGLPITARSGGHSYGGWSSGPGLVVDLAGISAIEARGESAIIGAGGRLPGAHPPGGGPGPGAAAASPPPPRVPPPRPRGGGRRP